jgi:hypothetical protein
LTGLPELPSGVRFVKKCFSLTHTDEATFPFISQYFGHARTQTLQAEKPVPPFKPG